MPIYEYECNQCGHTLEKLQKVGEAPLSDCPACGKAGLVKLVSAAGFRLKGGGWYETDFKTGNKKNVAGAEKAKPTADKKTGSAEKKTG
jgi:putative FmdB family regulatory protein